jgi:hypothetical protein
MVPRRGDDAGVDAVDGVLLALEILEEPADMVERHTGDAARGVEPAGAFEQCDEVRGRHREGGLV